MARISGVDLPNEKRVEIGQYLNRRRLEIACHLLESSNHSISDISTLTGFSSQSYFTQTFRKTYGTTPVKYRQLHSGTDTVTKKQT